MLLVRYKWKEELFSLAIIGILFAFKKFNQSLKHTLLCGQDSSRVPIWQKGLHQILILELHRRNKSLISASFKQIGSFLSASMQNSKILNTSRSLQHLSRVNFELHSHQDNRYIYIWYLQRLYMWIHGFLRVAAFWLFFRASQNFSQSLPMVWFFSLSK